MQYMALDTYEALRVWAETAEAPATLQVVFMPMIAPGHCEEHG